jgi:hypothetical protein
MVAIKRVQSFIIITDEWNLVRPERPGITNGKGISSLAVLKKSEPLIYRR